MPEFSEINIELDDGYSAYARYWPAAKCRGAVLHLHGIQSHCGWYTETARAINAAGFAVLQPDRRGSGRNQAERGHAESHLQLIADSFVCARKLRELSGVERVHLLGMSWGGKLVAAMHVSDPSWTASLTLVAPGIFPIIDVSSAEKFRIGWSMVSQPKRLFDIPLNDPTLFTDQPEWIRFLEEDALQIHQASAGFFLASRRMDRVVAKLGEAPAVPLHVFLAGDERIIDNERTRALVRELPWPTRFVTQYDKARHTLEFGPARDDYITDLVRWLEDPERYAAD